MHQSPELILAWLPGGMEWIIILVVMLLLFGKRLPEIMRGLGSSAREFKKGMDDVNLDKPLSPDKPDGSVSRSDDNDKEKDT
jgi:sec-independent protein translocase protein TatA